MSRPVISTQPRERLVAASAAASATASAGWALGLWARLVDIERTTSHLGSVQAGDGFLALAIIGHFHEAKTTRLAAVPVGNDGDFVDLPVCPKCLSQIIFGGGEIQIPDVNVFHTCLSKVGCSTVNVSRTSEAKVKAVRCLRRVGKKDIQTHLKTSTPASNVPVRYADQYLWS